MDGMGTHSAPEPQRRDHLWVAVIIAACALLEVWASWLGIAAVSGFPHLGRVTTGWILPVTTEAYWGYALYSWLGHAPGRRSRRFAMYSAVVVFALSLAGQECGHLLAAAHRPAPPEVVGLVTALPLFALGLIAILIHLRQADREDAAEAQRLADEAARGAEADRIAADERTGLRRQLADLAARADAAVSDLNVKLNQAASDLASARRDTAEALRRAEAAERKIAAVSDRKPPKPGAPRAKRAASASASDPTTELLALMELRANPELRQPRMGGELARKLGVSPATGRRYHKQYVNPDGSLSELAESLTGSLGERTE